MRVKELRLQVGLSQSKFADLFGIPVATLKDWEQERRTPPSYVVNKMKTILEYKGMIIDQTYMEACEKRRESVEKALAIIYTSTNGPDEVFLNVLESYILGKISLTEIEKRVDQLKYLGV